MPQPSHRYTHGYSEAVLRAHRWRTAENCAGPLLRYLKPGMELLDVGSGAGTITCDLAERAVPTRVTALEVSDTALDLVRREAASRGLTNLAFTVGDCHELPIDDNTFDLVHAHQVLQHVTDPVKSLAEMARVCRPGGVVAITDADYGGFRWYPPSAALDRWLQLYEAVARENGGHPDAGRRLLSWARQAALSDVEVSSSAWCFATPQDRAWWSTTWAERFTDSAISQQLRESGLATQRELAEIAEAWHGWAAAEDGWFNVPHGTLLVHVHE